MQVYTEALCRRHYSSIFSLAFIFRGLVFAAAVSLALVAAMASGGFWQELAVEIEHPKVHFTNDALAIFESLQPGQDVVWSTSTALNSALGSHAVPGSVQWSEQDSDRDSTPDALHFKLRVSTAAPVHSVKLLLQLTYVLQAASTLHMQSLAYVHAASPLPGAALYANGVLQLSQEEPLAHRALDLRFAAPPLGVLGQGNGTGPWAVQGSTPLVPRILGAYAARNVTTSFTPAYMDWQAGNAGNFLVDVIVRVPSSQVVLYRPPIARALKWAWVQLLAVFVALWWALSWLELGVFRWRVLETRVHVDLAARAGPAPGGGVACRKL